MNKKLESEIYDVLAAIDEYFEGGSQVYPSSLNPLSVEDETMQTAVKRVLRAMLKEAAALKEASK